MNQMENTNVVAENAEFSLLDLLASSERIPASHTGTNGSESQTNKVGKTYYGGTKCLDAIKSALTPEEYRGFLRGNVLKYVWRYTNKGGVKDLGKALDYLNWLVSESE